MGDEVILAVALLPVDIAIELGRLVAPLPRNIPGKIGGTAMPSFDEAGVHMIHRHPACSWKWRTPLPLRDSPPHDRASGHTIAAMGAAMYRRAWRAPRGTEQAFQQRDRGGRGGPGLW